METLYALYVCYKTYPMFLYIYCMNSNKLLPLTLKALLLTRILRYFSSPGCSIMLSKYLQVKQTSWSR